MQRSRRVARAILAIPVCYLVVGWGLLPAQSASSFMGRRVEIAKPQLDDDGFSSKGPASVCLDPPPDRQCYIAPKDFGRDPSLAVVELDKDTSALLFSAAGGGVSGWEIHLALLRPGTGTELDDLFASSNMTVSNQSQYTFWTEPSLSHWPIFVTADYIWGPGESHYSEHRYIVSAYIREFNSLANDLDYYLEDQYMTIRKYDLDGKSNVLDLEKQEVLARLRRVASTMKAPQK
ncbi:MAG: hypothetical protein JOY54_19640 [Acidobacteriaceae bacterium]|nr:hypothetical protein [Acidobacteriaceae bacterium]